MNEKTRRRWLLLLKGVTDGVTFLTEAELKELGREPELYHTAIDAAGIMLSLETFLEEKKLRRTYSALSHRQLLRLRSQNRKAQRRFLIQHSKQVAPQEDSRFERLTWKGEIIHNVLLHGKQPNVK